MSRSAFVTALTLARLPFVGLGYWAALKGDALGTITFGASAVATDIADGVFARRWKVETNWGSQLDSAADFIFYASLLVWVYLFVPEPLTRHRGLIVGFFVAYGLLMVAGAFFKRSIAAHTRVSRATGTAGGLVAVWFIAVGYQEWMFFALCLFGVADLGQRLHSVIQAIAVKRRLEA